MVVLPFSIKAEEVFIPRSFKEGQPIEQVILISDVDGVIRESVGASADSRIIDAIRSLLQNKNVDVTFISGTPVENDLTVEPWRRGNLPLKDVFGSSFKKELFEGRVTIFGVLGGHRMRGDGTLEVVDQYPPEISCELGKLLIHAFLKEVVSYGTPEQKIIAKQLQWELDSLKIEELSHVINVTSLEFHQIVSTIRESLDPNFRLISNGALIETHTSNPPWNTFFSCKWLKEVMDQPEYLVSQLASREKQMASGLAKKDAQGFNYLLISKTNKGVTTKRHIEEKMKLFPRALVITIGDTQVDFPMHQNAHLAFHVGLEQVWQTNFLPHCVLIRNHDGKDSQHVEGTLTVLKLLNDAIGKSFYDLKYIPKRDSLGKWNYHSLREIQEEKILFLESFKE